MGKKKADNKKKSAGNNMVLPIGGSIIYLPVEGKPEIIPSETITLQFLQELVGGYIEIIDSCFSIGRNRYGIVINENGKFMQIGVNSLATIYAAMNAVAVQDFIVGNAAIVKIDGENLIPIPAEETEKLMARYIRIPGEV